MPGIPDTFKKPVEIISENIEATGRDVNKQVFSGWDKNFAQSLVGGKEAYKTDAEIEQIKLHERMMKEPLYKKHLEDLAILKKNNTSETPNPETGQVTIKEIPNPYTQEEERELVSHFREQDRDLKSEVNEWGKPKVDTQQRERDEREEEAQQADDAAKAKQAESMNNQPEAVGKTPSGGFGRKKSSTRMTSPPATKERKNGIGG